MENIKIFTDGSCHTQKLAGAWAAFIYVNEKKTILSGTAENTSHHRMELTAVIESLQFVKTNYPELPSFEVVTDSLYVIGLLERAAKLVAANFISKKGNATRNVDLVKIFYALKDKTNPIFIKVQSHLPQTSIFNGNNEVDAYVNNLMKNSLD